MALFIAVQTFTTERRGRSEIVQAGEVAEGGSWPVGHYPGAFRPLEIRYKAPKPAPGEKKQPEPEVDEALLLSPSVSPRAMKHRGGGRGPKPS